jgi:FtsP/CotA-like multicopper oxidase with cupredoxin domain
MLHLSRRQLLASTGSAIAGAMLMPTLAIRPAKAAGSDPVRLLVESRVIEVDGRAAKVFGLRQPDGTAGLRTTVGKPFRVRLENLSAEPTLIHWHGLLPPYGQDGVPDMPQPLLPAGRSYDYDFPLETAGTHWMHAHTLQEQKLLAAPLIVDDPADAGRDEQQVVVLLHDFSFKSPEEILADLKLPATVGHGGHAGHGATGGKPAGEVVDANDIEYDAYLANDRTLDDPEVVRVERGGNIRLRLINGATATAFWIDLGTLDGELIAVDGNPVTPLRGRVIPLGMGQRADIRLALPRATGAWPVLALREGSAERTGFLLATQGAAIARIGPVAERASRPLDSLLEGDLRALRPLPARSADRRETIVLGGDMAGYAWTLTAEGLEDGQVLTVRHGGRIELTLDNRSTMGHPMHLHGHHFQVVAIDRRPLAGALRDTVWVPPRRSVTVAFDAANSGRWAFHCHHLYHMAAGMMATIAYSA